MPNRYREIYLKELGASVELASTDRARRLTLSVSATTGKVRLSFPSRTSYVEAESFLYRHIDWLKKEFFKIGPTTRVKQGSLIPVEDRMRTIKVNPEVESGMIFSNQLIMVAGPGSKVQQQVLKCLKGYAMEILSPVVQSYAREINKECMALKFRDTKGRWGSCSSSGRIMLNWRLIMAPSSVANYVAAHEVAHLAYLNHSQKFWNLVETLYPNYKAQKAWLKANGAALHRYEFTE